MGAFMPVFSNKGFVRRGGFTKLDFNAFQQARKEHRRKT